MPALLVALLLACSGGTSPKHEVPRAPVVPGAVAGTERAVTTGWPPADLEPGSCQAKPCSIPAPCVLDSGFVCVAGTACTSEAVSTTDAQACDCVTAYQPDSSQCRCGCLAPAATP